MVIFDIFEPVGVVVCVSETFAEVAFGVLLPEEEEDEFEGELCVALLTLAEEDVLELELPILRLVGLDADRVVAVRFGLPATLLVTVLTVADGGDD